MRKLKFKLDRESLEIIYTAFIRPLLEYSDVIWNNCTLQDKYELDKIQNEAARIATGTTKLVSLNSLYKEIGWESLEEIYKALNHLTPTYISDLLTPMSQSHKRTLRSSTDGSLAVPRSRTAMFDGSFSCSAPRLWNDLPECVRSAPSLNVFKKKVRERF